MQPDDVLKLIQEHAAHGRDKYGTPEDLIRATTTLNRYAELASTAARSTSDQDNEIEAARRVAQAAGIAWNILVYLWNNPHPRVIQPQSTE